MTTGYCPCSFIKNNKNDQKSRTFLYSDLESCDSKASFVRGFSDCLGQIVSCHLKFPTYKYASVIHDGFAASINKCIHYFCTEIVNCPAWNNTSGKITSSTHSHVHLLNILLIKTLEKLKQGRK